MASTDLHLRNRNDDRKIYWNVGNIHKSMQTPNDNQQADFAANQPKLKVLFSQELVAAPLFVDRYPIPNFKSSCRDTNRHKHDKNIQTTFREDAIYTEPPRGKRKYSKTIEKPTAKNLIKTADKIKSIVVLRDNFAAVLGNSMNETQSKRKINPKYMKLATEIHKSIRRMKISNKPAKSSIKSVIVINVDDDSDYSCDETDERTAVKRSSTGFAEKLKNHVVCEVLESIHADPPVVNLNNENSSRKRWSINPLCYLGFGKEEQNTSNEPIAVSHSNTSNESEPPKEPSHSIADEFRAMSNNLASTIISIPTVGARGIPGQDCIPRPRKKCRKCKQNPFCCHGPKCEFKDPVIAIQRPKCKKGGEKGCVYLTERSNLCPPCPLPSTCDPNKPQNCYSCDFCDIAYPRPPRDSSTDCRDHGRLETTSPRDTSCPLRPTKEQCRACEEKKRKAALRKPGKPLCPSPSQSHHQNHQQNHRQERPAPARSPCPTPVKHENYQYSDRSVNSISYSDNSQEARLPEKRHVPAPHRKPPFDPSKYACEPEISNAERILNMCNDLVAKGKDLAASLTQQVCQPLQKPSKPVCSAACPRREPPPEDPCCEIQDTFDRLMCNMAHKGANVVKQVVDNCGSAIAPDEHKCKRPLPTVDDVTKKVIETFGSAFCSSNSANSAAPCPSTKDEEFKPKTVSNDYSDHDTKGCSLFNTIRSAITDIFADSGTMIKNCLMEDITYIDLSASNETMSTESNVKVNISNNDSPSDSYFFIC